MPIRTDWPKVGETIYVIGAPLYTKMQDTVTKGIVSSHRKNYRWFGTNVDFIQGDVMIQGGNSGGPMIDRYGNIAGISTGAITVSEAQTDLGLNFFIPVGSALRALDITLGAGDLSMNRKTVNTITDAASADTGTATADPVVIKSN